VRFEVVVSGAAELTSGPPVEVAAENGYRKAADVAAARPEAIVLGVDTVVAVGTRVYGKPADEAEARETLETLAGRRHTVFSGVCVIEGDRVRTAVASTVVEFRPLEPALLDWYLASEEWRERAGGYAIQGRGAALVNAIDGDYSNVVGLPVPTVLALLPGLVGPDQV
jgi:septum formation protein